MFAIIETGGKQYKVEKGSTFQVEKIEAEDGSTITIDKVLLISGEGKLNIGNPMIDGAAVMAKVISQVKGEKLRIYKMKPKDHYQRTTGHRQKYTLIEITDIRARQRSSEPKGEPSVSEANTNKIAPPKKAPAKKTTTKKPVAKKTKAA